MPNYKFTLRIFDDTGSVTITASTEAAARDDLASNLSEHLETAGLDPDLMGAVVVEGVVTT